MISTLFFFYLSIFRELVSKKAKPRLNLEVVASLNTHLLTFLRVRTASVKLRNKYFSSAPGA